MVIGILDIMGSVEEHASALQKCGVKTILVKSKQDLDKISGLIIPGGESTTIGKLLKLYGLDKEIKKRAQSKEKPLAIWGTCAGAILLAKKVLNRKSENLGLMNVAIERNAYGRQIDSFETEIKIPTLNSQKIPAVFIRAPRLRKTGKHVQILAHFEKEPIMIRQKNLLATMFHPELTNDLNIHRYFIKMCKKSK